MTLKRHAGIRLLRMTKRASWVVESEQTSGLSAAAPASPVKPSAQTPARPHALLPPAFGCVPFQRPLRTFGAQSREENGEP